MEESQGENESDGRKGVEGEQEEREIKGDGTLSEDSYLKDTPLKRFGPVLLLSWPWQERMRTF